MVKRGILEKLPHGIIRDMRSLENNFSLRDIAAGQPIMIGREIFKLETCDKCGSTWDKLDPSGTSQGDSVTHSETGIITQINRLLK